MKYNININQLKWREICPEAKFNHAIVFEAIKSICDSKSKKMIRTEDGFTYVSSQKIIDELPMLQIKSKNTLTPIIQNLEKWGIIETHHESGQRKFYKTTEKAEQIYRDVETSQNQDNRSKNRTGAFEKPNGLKSEQAEKRSKNRTDHIDHNTIDQENEEKIIPPPTPKNGSEPDRWLHNIGRLWEIWCEECSAAGRPVRQFNWSSKQGNDLRELNKITGGDQELYTEKVRQYLAVEDKYWRSKNWPLWGLVLKFEELDGAEEKNWMDEIEDD